MEGGINNDGKDKEISLEENFDHNVDHPREMIVEKEVMMNATLINEGISIKASEKKESKKSLKKDDKSE